MNEYYLEGTPRRIGSSVQLLLDDDMVEDCWQIERRVGQVSKHLRNPVLVQDKPWEDTAGTYPCVLYDEAVGVYRMWYSCFNLSYYFSRKGPGYYIGYAESKDGFNWVKPELEGFPFGGHECTNIVFSGRRGSRANAAQVFLNPDRSDPQRRYLMVYVGGPVELAFSPDGLHWTVAEEPIIGYHSDCANHVLWIPEQQLWYMYLRPPVRAAGTNELPEGQRHTRRRLAFATSPDLRHWTTPRTVLYPDERDQPDYDGLRIFRRHGVFVCLYAQMYQESGESEAETLLATSRDGIHWERTWDRTPLIPRGPEGAFDHGQVEPSTSPPVEMGADLLFYYYASPVGQKHWHRANSVGVCRLRKDRFIGRWAGDRTGYLLTRQFVLEGSRLLINCSSEPKPYQDQGTGIQVGIVEAPDWGSGGDPHEERPIPGYALDDCDRIVSNQLEKVVSWRGSADLSALKGRSVYLRFRMKQAGLYSFQVAA